MENNELYAIHFICTGNSCRSRMAQAIMQDTISQWEKAGMDKFGLEGKILEARSSGMQVDDIHEWGKTDEKGGTKEFKWDTIMKVLKVAYNNGIHTMSNYKGFVEQVIGDEKAAKQSHDNDPLYRRELNIAAGNVYQLVEQFDRASTMLALAEHNLIYPKGDPRQFAPDNSWAYVPMERKHAEKVGKRVKEAGEDSKIFCFDDLAGVEMKGSLGAISLEDGKLDIRGFNEIYETIKGGCNNLSYQVRKELSDV